MEYSILMPGAVVEEGATVRYSIVAEKAVIAKGAEVGGSPSDSDVDNWGVAVVAEGVRIGSGAKLAAKERRGSAGRKVRGRHKHEQRFRHDHCI